MNGTEQRQHRTAVLTVEARLSDLQDVLAAHLQHTEQLRVATKQRLEELERDRYNVLIDQTLTPMFLYTAIQQESDVRRAVIDEDRELLERNRANLDVAFANIGEGRREFYNFRERTFWQRLRWLMTGR